MNSDCNLTLKRGLEGYKATNYESHSRSKRQLNELSLLALVLPLSACGGGGSGNSSTSIIETSQTNTSNNAVTTSTASSFVSAPSGTLLSLAKTGSGYSASSYAGVSLKDTGAHLFVSDDTRDNAYEMKLSAEGTGILEFEFEDSADTVTLIDGSTIDGFSQLNVTIGTLDATAADIGDVEKVVVASGIKITYSQITALKSIVSNSATSKIEVAVANDEEAKALETFINSGELEMFLVGGSDALKVEEAPAAVVSTTVLTSVVSVAGGAAAAAPAPSAAVLVPPEVMTILEQKAAATLSIANDDTYINAEESSSNIKFKVDLQHGYTVKSLTVGGVSASSTGVAGEYQIATPNLVSGANQVVLTVQDPIAALAGSSTQGGLVVLNGVVHLDTVAPSDAVINVAGASNGLNNLEASGNVNVSILAPSDASITNVVFDGGVITNAGNGSYSFDASALVDGAYSISADLVDSAGNKATVSETFTVNKTSSSEPIISVAGADGGLNSSEATSSVAVTVDPNGAASITSATVGGSSLSSTGSNSYSLNAAVLSEGIHTLEAIGVDASGAEVRSQLDILIDTLAPGQADIVVSNSQYGLTPAELADPISVFVTPEAGSVVTSASIGGVNLTQVSDGVYSLNGRSLSPGRYDITTTSTDSAGNSSVSSKEITVLGTTNAISSAFEVVSSESSGIFTVDLYIKNSLEQFPNGIPTYDFDIQLNTAHLDYIEGSFQGFEGSSYEVGESSSADGLVRVSGLSSAAFQDYEAPFMSLQANVLSTFDTTKITLSDVTFYRTDFGDVDYYASV